jgi:hypothetical protein
LLAPEQVTPLPAAAHDMVYVWPVTGLKTRTLAVVPGAVL